MARGLSSEGQELRTLETFQRLDLGVSIEVLQGDQKHQNPAMAVLACGDSITSGVTRTRLPRRAAILLGSGKLTGGSVYEKIVPNSLEEWFSSKSPMNMITTRLDFESQG